ncbi:uncharacterized protein YAE1-like [Pomacea canaliculata]|uniref:uncharacterized protein YAE1-like n=1 Tax=Pomacea canaliculata TaxID=400727 RepID=UPI000D72C66D|nr:uncharacterized protein YAE1-like [Pomacea canaliculata]
MAQWMPSAISEIDEIFDDSVEENAIAQREWERAEGDIKKTGYRLGVSAGEEETLQQGFDAGYKDTSPLAFAVGQMLGRISATKNVHHILTPQRETTQVSEEKMAALSSLEQDCTILLRTLIQRQQEHSAKFAAASGENCALNSCAPEAQRQQRPGGELTAASDERELTQMFRSCSLQDWSPIDDPVLQQMSQEILARCELLCTN